MHEPFDEWVKKNIEKTQNLLQSGRRCLNICLADCQNGDRIFIKAPCADKKQVASMISFLRIIFAIKQVYRYMHLTEGWAIQRTEYNKEEPALCDDRISVLSAMAISYDKRSGWCAKINKHDDKIDFDVMEGTFEPEGALCELLPDIDFTQIDLLAKNLETIIKLYLFTNNNAEVVIESENNVTIITAG